MTTRANAANRDERRKQATARNEKWAKLSPAQQLASLDQQKLSAPRQRARLAKILSAQS